MFNIVLYQPEIPPNTGNIIRLCANTGASLHLIEPLGFTLEDKKLKRAGLDYIEWSRLMVWPDLPTYRANSSFNKLYAISTKGRQHYAGCRFTVGDSFLFGPETRGLPEEVLEGFEENAILRIPMRDNSRSMNLSNAAAVIVYEAWRQNNFEDLSGQVT